MKKIILSIVLVFFFSISFAQKIEPGANVWVGTAGSVSADFSVNFNNADDGPVYGGAHIGYGHYTGYEGHNGFNFGIQGFTKSEKKIDFYMQLGVTIYDSGATDYSVYVTPGILIKNKYILGTKFYIPPNTTWDNSKHDICSIGFGILL
jgi:hypothetical protein